MTDPSGALGSPARPTRRAISLRLHAVNGKIWRGHGAWKIAVGAIKHKGGLKQTVMAIAEVYRREGFGGLAAIARAIWSPDGLYSWYARYRAGSDERDIPWRGTTRFSVIMPIHKVRPAWLEAAIESVRAQTYPHWELICVDDGSQSQALSAILTRVAVADRRVRVKALDRNHGVSQATNIGLDQATGDYVVLMDHDDVLEPHALARFADAAFQDDADILYGDEVITTEDSDTMLGVQARPTFSHIFYMSYPFFVHPLVVRTTIARKIGGLNPALKISQDIDFVLRALEVAKTVTHVPDILYRWRTNGKSAGHLQRAAVMETTCALKSEHLRRIGFPDAVVRPGLYFNTFRVRYFAAPTGRVLAIIPTKNQARLLRQCIDTIRSTTRGLSLDVLVVDHQSEEADALSYFDELRTSGAARVIRYEGTFNYSAINNHAVAAGGAGYDYFLFLNNDIEARHSGWLEPMIDLAMRADVGAVGATLLYPDGTVQHSGVIVGMHGAAEHAFKNLPYRLEDPGYLASLFATREYSAVTAACMLVPAPAFHAIQGFDPRLEVGFNDTDFCLRLVREGLRVVNCEEAVLVHHESATRGKTYGADPHPSDSALFTTRYASLLNGTDPHFSPLLNKKIPTFSLDGEARLIAAITYDTVTDVLPKGRRGCLGERGAVS